jgi:hypothetical protein
VTKWSTASRRSLSSIFAFFFTISGASLISRALGGFWLAALVLFSARFYSTHKTALARSGPRAGEADAAKDGNP